MQFTTGDLRILRLVCNTTSECDDCPEKDLCDFIYKEVGEYKYNPQDWTDENIELIDL